MANEKVSALPGVASSSDSDILYAIQSGISVKETVKQVSDRVFGNIALTYAGNPNGNVAGTQKQYLYDSANDFIWFCKTTGTTSTAVWIPAFGTMTNGQLVIGNTGTQPTVSTLTAGTGISIVNGAGSITITSTGMGFSYTEVTGTSQAMATNQGYISNNASQVALTLPVTASIGDKVEVAGKGTGGWRITQGASQQIHIGSNSSTVGAGGYVESQTRYDSVKLVCITANNEWSTLNAPQGNLTTA